MNEFIGKPLDRVDGRLKVTGAATYTAEFDIKNLAYGVAVQSTVSKGRIKSIDTKDSLAHPGVLDVITYQNAMKLQASTVPGSGKWGEKDLMPLQNDKIFYDGQHVAIVVAETFESAQHGAALLKVDYDEEKPAIEIEQSEESAFKPKGGPQYSKGDITAGLQNATTKISQTYSTPVYHHNPMEPQATIAEWKGDELTLYDGTQSVYGSRNLIAGMLGTTPEKVRLICLYLGGGFGCKGFTWHHSVMAPMAAKHVGRPVKMVLDRMQMFTSNGRRSRTIQEISLGAGEDNKLTAIQHATNAETSFVDEFLEQAGTATRILYDSPNVDVSHSLVKLNKISPCPCRAPGEAPGTYAFEVAMDELAYQLKTDPIQLRLANYAEVNPQNGHPWSSKHLRECYQRGAELIGWPSRNPIPASMKEGKFLLGYGMATAIYAGNRGQASAKVKVYPDGHVVAGCCTQDIGTGTYTILAQTTAQALGIPMDKVTVKLGDTILPKGPGSGGSQTAATAGPAVQAAALDAKSKIIQKAIADKKSPLFGQTEEAIDSENGRLFIKADKNKGETYTQLLTRLKVEIIEGEANLTPSNRDPNKEPNPNRFARADEEVDRKKYAFQSFGAQFVKVLVDPDLGMVKVAKCVGVMDIGTVLNPKTATNQIMGGMIWGLGMALMEETMYDPNNGRVITRDLADYHVPVNADIPEFEIEFLNKPDPYISPMGARGIGEIGITGITAAIANAVYHATGKRVRDLPITPDKLL